MASLRSLTFLTRISTQRNIRSTIMWNTRVLTIRREYATAPPTGGKGGGFSPLLWIGNPPSLFIDNSKMHNLDMST